MDAIGAYVIFSSNRDIDLDDDTIRYDVWPRSRAKAQRQIIIRTRLNDDILVVITQGR